MNTKYRNAIICIAISCLLFYMSGIEFKRGYALFTWGLATVFATLIAYAIGVSKKKEESNE